MNVKLLYKLVFLLSVLPLPLMAQSGAPEYRTEKSNDVQFRTGFEVEKKISRWLSAEWSEELRLKDNIQAIDRIYSDVAFSFKAAKWLKFTTGYTYIAVLHEGKKKNDYHHYWESRHRLTAGVTFSYKTPNNWEFSLKERAQVTFYADDDFDKREKCDPAWTLKSKLTAGYDCPRVPLNPYASVELCNTLNVPKVIDHNYLDKVRSAVGVVYRINKHHSLNAFYRFDYNLEKDPNVKNSTGALKTLTEETAYNNIFGISYKFKF